TNRLTGTTPDLRSVAWTEDCHILPPPQFYRTQCDEPGKNAHHVCNKLQHLLNNVVDCAIL
ncbi:hypothetical protein GBAR_LOCUS25318, partial [Geodia barretti]